MGELADEWSSRGHTNIWSGTPQVTEMQSEAGAIGAVHGSLQAGAMATTFTSSQGLLLMIPNMFKIAGELTPFAMHVAARTVATHALSIFGDHSDVMACRQTGFAMLASGSVQEAHDMACISHAATLATRLPFLHFFDGFRTSHEVSKIEALGDDVLRAMISEPAVAEHRRRALSPDHPTLRGTAQNPDVFFQAREACNPFYDHAPLLVQETMDRFASLTGRQYRLCDYVGHPEAERVIVMMGSGSEAAHDTIDWLAARGEKVGLIKVRLYRPFPLEQFAHLLPPSVRAIAVLDRTKEPGAVGEPLYVDVVTGLRECAPNGSTVDAPVIVGGRYGLSSKEFTPAMVKGVLDELTSEHPKRHFTIGITDDVTHLSLPYDPEFDIESPEVIRAVFFGLGSDGTVGANKNSIKIIADETDHAAQGYFVYDSKKAGAVTVSHLRFGPGPIRATYRINQASFVACHHFDFLEQFDILEHAAVGAVVLLNCPYGPDEIWDQLPREMQETIVEKKLSLHVIDAERVARESGIGRRVNTIMQTCFFAISEVLPRQRAIDAIKSAIEKTYGKRGLEVVRRNCAAVDHTLSELHRVELPSQATSARARPPVVPAEAPDFVQRVTAVIMANQGDLLPVSAFPVDGTWVTGTTKWEKRNIAQDIPVWDSSLCIQCNKCAIVCPHAAIRAKVYAPDWLSSAPATFKSMDFKGAEYRGQKYTIQVAPEDCTGCNLCVVVCPAKDKSNPRHKAIDMHPQRPLRAAERENYAFFLDLPEVDRLSVKLDVKGSQFLEPLFEYSGACAGCGETPYLKLLTQLFGDRIFMANATGCSSIYGGNLPTTPYTTNRDGRGPAWANSLFEDNAEFGFGMRLALDQHAARARTLVGRLAPNLDGGLVSELLGASQLDELGISDQRKRVIALRSQLAGLRDPDARLLEELSDYLVDKSVWIVGGDGWAYDIGYGGLDHVLSTQSRVRILVLDTEVYSNTGGQQSKATPMAAAAKFAIAGKALPKKDLAGMAMAHGHVYVATVAFGARDTQTVRAMVEAESYPGTSIVIAYSHCIAHGYDMAYGAEQQKSAVGSGHWPLFRFDPRRTAKGLSPLQLDSPAPKIGLKEFMNKETRFRLVEQQDPERFRRLLAISDREARARYEHLVRLAQAPNPAGDAGT
jgi:pyruvate-ferredoxin/flavodoxin oxidoreductase